MKDKSLDALVAMGNGIVSMCNSITPLLSNNQEGWRRTCSNTEYRYKYCICMLSLPVCWKRPGCFQPCSSHCSLFTTDSPTFRVAVLWHHQAPPYGNTKPLPRNLGILNKSDLATLMPAFLCMYIPSTLPEGSVEFLLDTYLNQSFESF